jgi:hypothetical protein
MPRITNLVVACCNFEQAQPGTPINVNALGYVPNGYYQVKEVALT